MKSILAIALVIFFLGTTGCSKKVKKAPAATEGKQTEQSMSRQQFLEVAQADEYEEDEASDDEYSDDDSEGASDNTDDVESSDESVTDDENSDDTSADDESEYDDTESSDW